MLKQYMANNKKVGKFGIKYLDEKLGGILLSDFVLIGARSGAGKTTISNMIASANRNIGVKVTLFSLENFEGDCYLEKAYYKYIKLMGLSIIDLPMREFVSGSIEFNEEALKHATNYAYKCYDGINIINRQKKYGIDQLKDDIIKAVETNGSELIIIDHLDYVSKYSNENENAHVTELMRTLREVQDSFKVAIVAISHLRKSVGNTKTPLIIPSLEEFIGSSNKYKEATAVIMLAPDDAGNMQAVEQNNSQRYTWACIRKLRFGGYDSTAANMVFDLSTGQYKSDYALYKVDYLGIKAEPVANKSIYKTTK